MIDHEIHPDAVREKKLAEYGANLNNFAASQELTVTITLSEYRTLVSNAATRDDAIKMATNDKFAREQEIRALKESVAQLKAENYELQKRLSHGDDGGEAPAT